MGRGNRSMMDIRFSLEQKRRINDFLCSRTKISDRKIATRFHDSDAHVYDLAFIRPFLRPNRYALDLGTGSGLLAYEMAKVVEKVIAVDKYESFFSPQYRSDNLEFIECDVHDFKSKHRFDIVLLFGVITYLDYEQSIRVYQLAHNLLNDDGVLLVKHGCGLKEDVLVDGYSEHLNSHYVALYKQVEVEKQLLAEYFNVEVVDIYPQHLNRWENTKYFGFILSKN